MVIHGRTSSLMPSGVTTRAQTGSAGASMTLCRSMIMTIHGRRARRPSGRYVEPPRLSVPTFEQGRNLFEEECVEVAHLGEALPGQAAVLGRGDAGLGPVRRAAAVLGQRAQHVVAIPGGWGGVQRGGSRSLCFGGFARRIRERLAMASQPKTKYRS